MRRTEVIEQIKDIIRHVAPTAKTILYGSQARNEARSDSDIDLLILLDGEKITLKEEEAITLPYYERYFRRREPKSIDRLQNATCL